MFRNGRYNYITKIKSILNKDFFKQWNVRARVQSHLYVVSYTINGYYVKWSYYNCLGPPHMGVILADAMGRDPKPTCI